MNIFLLLSLFFLSLSDASFTRSRGNKRSINSADNEADVGTSSPNVKRPKLDPNAKAKIFKIPSETLAYIGTFLENPFETLSPVSFDFRMAMKSFTPQFLLNSRTCYENLEKIPLSREFAQLLRVEPVYLNSKIDRLLFPGSVFVPTSSVTVEYAIKNIIARIPLRSDKIKAVSSLINHLVRLEEYESILVILRNVSGFEINFTDLTFLTNFLVHIYESNNFVDFHVLKRGCNKKWSFFMNLASLPISFDIYFSLLHDETIDMEIFLSLLAASCAIALPFSLSEEQQNLIRNRNLQIISLFEDAPEVLVEFVFLCNDMRYSEHSSFQISNQFLVRLNEYSASLENTNPRKKMKFFYETLIVIALMRGYKTIFAQLMTSKRFTLNSLELAILLQKSPEFIELLSPAQFKQIYGIKDQVLLFEAGKISREEVPYIKNIYERIRVMSCYMEPAEFINQVQVLYATHDFSIAHLIQKVINQTKGKNLAKIVHLILLSFEGKTLNQTEISKLSIPLGNPKYLKSILRPGNEEFLILPSEQFYILVTADNFKEILKLSFLLKQEKAKNLRDRFLVKWISVFRDLRLFPHEIEKFFDIFNLKIGNFNYSRNFPLAADTILKDSRVLFKDPQFFSQFIDLMLIQAAEIIDRENLATNYWFSLDKSNPLLLKSYAIHKLWHDRNFESFVLNSRKTILRAFIPEVSDSFLRKLIFDPNINVPLVSMVLLKVIPSAKGVEIKVKDVHELRILFYENIAKLSDILEHKSNCKIVIDWISVIESSGTIIDYEVILSIVTQKELVLIFDKQVMSPEFIEFAEYFFDTYLNRIYPEINRNII